MHQSWEYRRLVGEVELDRLGADGYGVDAANLRRALDQAFNLALDYTLEDM